MTSFTRPSLALVLQATNAGGKRPGNEARGKRPGNEARGKRPGNEARGKRPGNEARGKRPGNEARGKRPGNEARGKRPGNEARSLLHKGMPTQQHPPKHGSMQCMHRSNTTCIEQPQGLSCCFTEAMLTSDQVPLPFLEC